MEALKEFVRSGGSLVLIDNATALATERLGVPVRNPLAGLSEKEFFAPGSSLRVHVDPTQPLGYGMPKETTVVFFESTAFDLNNSNANDRISMVARYHDRDLLRGGWLDGEKHLAGRPALMDVGYGKGHIAMIGFRAQNRAQAYGTFKVLFNALYQAGAVRDGGVSADLEVGRSVRRISGSVLKVEVREREGAREQPIHHHRDWASASLRGARRCGRRHRVPAWMAGFVVFVQQGRRTHPRWLPLAAAGPARVRRVGTSGRWVQHPRHGGRCRCLPRCAVHRARDDRRALVRELCCAPRGNRLSRASERLVLIGTGWLGSNDVIREVHASLRDLADPVSRDFARDFQASTAFAPVPEPFFEQIVTESLKLPSRLWPELLGSIIRYDDRTELGGISAPTLLLWGDRDALFSREDQDRLAAVIPHATLRIYPEIGHCPNWECPDELRATS